MPHEGNQINSELRAKLQNFKWSPNNVLDLHSLGINYFNPDYLPVSLDPLTFASMIRRGFTPPQALPMYFPEDIQARIKSWLDLNYYKLTNAGIQYLGSEYNIQREEDWDKAEIRVCLCRMSDYATLDGAFGPYLINNFVQDFTDNIFIDFSYLPAPADMAKLADADLPMMFGNITKRPLMDFDIIIIATSYPGERINVPFALVKSGLPLYRWQRFDKNLPYRDRCPIIATAGIGSSFIENGLGDNPVKGLAANAWFDHVLIGEGEMMDLKYIQEYLNTVIRDGGTKEDFMKALTNEHHKGVYDPSLFLFEYADKVHVTRDYLGNEIARDVYPGGGTIKNIFMVDAEEKVKYSMAGKDSQEFMDLEAVNVQYHARLTPDADASAELGRRYVKISDRPTPEQRVASGMAPVSKDQPAEAGQGEKVQMPQSS